MKKTINILQELEKLEKKEHLFDELDSYRQESFINLKLKNTEELFNPLDPDPLEVRDLSQDVTDYLFDKSQKLPKNNKITINIEIESINDKETEIIKKSISNHFMEKAQEQLYLNRKEHTKWTHNTIKGLICLALCLGAAHIFGLPRFEDIAFCKVLSESIGILGWVAIWEPAEYYLYGRKSNNLELIKYMKLHRANINITHQ